MIPAGNKATCLSLVNHSEKTIHYHHHHHLLVIASTISLDLPRMIPIFYEAILNVSCEISHDVDLIGPFPVLLLKTPSTVSSPALPEKFVKNLHV